MLLSHLSHLSATYPRRTIINSGNIILDAEWYPCIFINIWQNSFKVKSHFFIFMSVPDVSVIDAPLYAVKVLDFGTGASVVNSNNQDSWYLLEVHVGVDPGYDIVTNSSFIASVLLKSAYNNVSVVVSKIKGFGSCSRERPQVNGAAVREEFNLIVDELELQHHEACLDHHLYKLAGGKKTIHDRISIFTRPLIIEDESTSVMSMFRPQDIYDYVMEVKSGEGMIETLAYRYARDEITVTEDFDCGTLLQYLTKTALSDIRDLVHHLLESHDTPLDEWSSNCRSPFECECPPLMNGPVTIERLGTSRKVEIKSSPQLSKSDYVKVYAHLIKNNKEIAAQVNDMIEDWQADIGDCSYNDDDTYHSSDSEGDQEDMIDEDDEGLMDLQDTTTDRVLIMRSIRDFIDSSMCHSQV